MSIFRIKNQAGQWIDIPVLQGPAGKDGNPGPQGEAGKDGAQGERGPSGVYVGHNPPNDALIWVEPDGTPTSASVFASQEWGEF